MSSRMKRCTLALTLALSAGALALPPAQASPVRSDSPPASAIQGDLVTRNFFEALRKLWVVLKDSSPWPGASHHPSNREGSGVCPHGGGPGH